MIVVVVVVIVVVLVVVVMRIIMMMIIITIIIISSAAVDIDQREPCLALASGSGTGYSAAPDHAKMLFIRKASFFFSFLFSK